MKITIRKLGISDIKQTALVYSKAIHKDYISYGEISYGLSSLNKFSSKAKQHFGKYITSSIDREDLRVYVAIFEKNVIGFICVEIKEVEAGHKECWIIDLGVDKNFRRLGIAKKLIQKAYSFGENNQVKYFFLESGYSNLSAHSLFEAEGFAPLNVVFVKKA